MNQCKLNITVHTHTHTPTNLMKRDIFHFNGAFLATQRLGRLPLHAVVETETQLRHAAQMRVQVDFADNLGAKQRAIARHQHYTHAHAHTHILDNECFARATQVLLLVHLQLTLSTMSRNTSFLRDLMPSGRQLTAPVTAAGTTTSFFFDNLCDSCVIYLSII